MFWLIVSLVLTWLFWSWINRLIKRGFELGERIAISNEVAAENLAILVEALSPDALERVAAAAETRKQRNIEQLRRDAQSYSQQQTQQTQQTKKLGVWILAAAVAIGVLALVISHARADDHVIRPQCWEENKGDHVERHCSVNGADPAVRAPRPSPRIASTPVAPPPPIAEPPVYQPPPAPPVRAWPTAQCAYGPPPCPVYYDRIPRLPPPYYGPPGLVFGFGPLTVVIH